MSDRGGVGGVVGGERRPLTVLFCDLVGSTSMSAQLDPEDYAEVILEYHQAARRVVEAHGGVVAQFLGDGVVIEFGYPVAHENDTERAVETALDLQRELAALSTRTEADFGVGLRCRMGIHAGVTVVGRMGPDPDSDVAMFGTTTNVAARVQAEAAPGEIHLSDGALHLLGHRYLVDQQRTVVLRGIDEPVTIARLVGRGPSAHHAPATDLVARAHEHDLLTRRWTQAARGRGGAVVVVGPAGVGKSTLVDSLRSAVDPAERVEVRARELTTLTPFSTIAELAASCRGDDVLHDAAAAVESAIGDAGRSAEQARQLVLERCADLGAALGQAGRLIVVEDVHWLDSSSRDALRVLVDAVAGSRSLLVATSRDTDQFAHIDLIRLEPLDPDGARALLASLTVERPLPATVVDEIVTRAGGVPLYVVALTEAAQAGRGAQLPVSLQSSLLSRLDRFPEIRRSSQVASVIGDPVDPELLAALMAESSYARDPHPAPMGAMLDAGVLVAAGDGSAVFSHALLREAVYESLLQRERRRLHLLVATAIEARGGRDDERIGVVAHHLEHANQAIEAADAFAIAARRSARRGAAVEAIALADRGLRLLSDRTDGADVALHLTMTKGNATFAVDGYGAPGLLELWQRAEQLATVCDNRTELSSAMNGQAVVALFAGDYGLSAERAERIARFGREHDDRPALVRGHCSLALAELWAGDCTAALADARRVIELYADGDDQLLTYGFGTDHAVIAYSAGGLAAWFAGDPDATWLTERAIEHGARIESPISLCTALQQAAVIELIAGRFAAAIGRSDELIATAERFSLNFFAELGRMTRATARTSAGEPDAHDDMLAALTTLMAGDSQLGATVGLLHLALSQEATGQHAAAAGSARFGLELAAERNEFIFEVELASVMARCSDDDGAWARLTTAAQRAEERGALASAARAWAAIDERDGPRSA